jgi:hypothetical protein
MGRRGRTRRSADAVVGAEPEGRPMRSSGQNPKVGRCGRRVVPEGRPMRSSGDQLEGRPVLATALTGLLAVSARFSRPSARASQ